MVNPLGLRQFSSSSSGISLESSFNRDGFIEIVATRFELEVYCGMVKGKNGLHPYLDESLAQQSFRKSLYAILKEVMTYDICTADLNVVKVCIQNRDAAYVGGAADEQTLINQLENLEKEVHVESLFDLVLIAYTLNFTHVLESKKIETDVYVKNAQLIVEKLTSLPCNIGDELDKHIVLLQTVANLIVPQVSYFQTTFLLEALVQNEPTNFFLQEFNRLLLLTNDNINIDVITRADHLNIIFSAFPILLENKEKLFHVFPCSPNMDNLYSGLVNSYFMLLQELWCETLIESRDELHPFIEETIKDVFLEFPFHEKVLKDRALEELNVTRTLDTYLRFAFWKEELGMKV